MKKHLVICMLASTAACGLFDGGKGGGTGGSTDGGTPGPGFVGRYIANADGSYDMDWSGSEMRANFEGTGISVELDELTAPQSWPDGTTSTNEYDVSVDNGAPTVLQTKGGANNYELASGLSSGQHSISVRKRTEADVGTVRFQGFTVAGGNLLAPPADANRKILMVGDSITAGYGDLGTSVTCTYSPATEDADKTYGILAGEQLSADVSIVAWAGKGVVRNADGSTTKTVPELYPLAAPNSSSAQWDPSQWQADAVVINLGTNDFQGTNPDASSFEAAYVSLLKQIRSDYPNAHIFCCLGPMLSDNYPTGLNQLTTARTDIQAAMSTFGDSKTHYVEFPVLTTTMQGCEYHPNTAAHTTMGKTLATAISQALGWN